MPTQHIRSQLPASIWHLAVCLVLLGFTVGTAVGSEQLPSHSRRGLRQTNILITSGLQDGSTLGPSPTGDGLKLSTAYNGVTQFGGVKGNTSGTWGQIFMRRL